MTKRITLLEADLKSSISRTRWLFAGGFISVAAVIISIFYSDTIWSAVHLWLTINTYSYAFAVLPIAGMIVWMRREYFRASVPAPTFSGIIVVMLFAAIWYAAGAADILEAQHLAFSGVLAGVIVGASGWQTARHFALPILYLFLLAPAGTPLLPFLQDITTFLATTFLHWGRIPLYTEGYFIEVATGKYEVAPGCAGLNFVLALATVAPLYSEMMYTSWFKRWCALSLMLLFVPVANSIRVFGIVAIAEYTNRAIDISADHLFYGWVFFSAIVLVMFAVGMIWADKKQAPAPIMPWGGHYTLAELMADPILVRMRYVLMAAILASIAFPVYDLIKAP